MFWSGENIVENEWILCCFHGLFSFLAPGLETKEFLVLIFFSVCFKISHKVVRSFTKFVAE